MSESLNIIPLLQFFEFLYLVRLKFPQASTLKAWISGSLLTSLGLVCDQGSVVKGYLLQELLLFHEAVRMGI